MGSATLVLPGVAAAAQQDLKEFSDQEYGYSFRYPAGWQLRNLPEGEANPDMRVIVLAPNGSSFMVVMEKVGRRTTQEEFDSPEERKAKVERLMSQTIEQIYRTIAKNINAVAMNVGERRDLSNDVGIKLYLATVHKMRSGRPIVVAGIHSFPFGKDYSVNFIMSAFGDGVAKKEQEILAAVFNSFRLAGEGPAASGPGNRHAPDGRSD